VLLGGGGFDHLPRATRGLGLSAEELLLFAAGGRRLRRALGWALRRLLEATLRLALRRCRGAHGGLARARRRLSGLLGGGGALGGSLLGSLAESAELFLAHGAELRLTAGGELLPAHRGLRCAFLTASVVGSLGGLRGALGLDASSGAEGFLAPALDGLTLAVGFGLLLQFPEEPGEKGEAEEEQDGDEAAGAHDTIIVSAWRGSGVTRPEEHAARAHAWRLAVLLTGRVEEAEEGVEQVLADRGALSTLPPARLDRLVALRCREIVGRRSAGRSEPAAGRALAALDRLAQQPREAFALIEVGGRSMIDAARAMDCSRTAASRHLERARAALAGAVEEGLAPVDVEGVRAEVERLNPGASVERIGRRRRVRRRRRVVLILCAAGVVVGAAILGLAMM
jgi:predicted DNA-binding protein (UPF0251 family)